MKNLKYILTSLILIVFSGNAFAQGGEKINLYLHKIMNDNEMQQKQINLLVQGDVSFIKGFAESHSGVFRYSVADIATIKIPVSAIRNLMAFAQVKRIESPVNNYTVMNDSTRSTVRANDVHAGLPPLPQGYNGAGVVVGIIDTGVDLTHPDLQDSLGNTRIKFLWDQRLPAASNTPSYGYGQEWNNTEIDAGLAAASNDVQWFGHGTHVSGIAASDGSANGKNKGIAPAADLIEVAFDFYNTTDPTYIDAVDYIFTKAQLLGKPCVINASLGDYYGSHDGYDLQSQMISALLNQQSGRVMVAAAGNAGTIPFHLGYTVTSDTSWTWMRHNPAYQSNYFQVWGDTSDFKFTNLAIGADVNTTTASFRGRTAFRNIFYNLGVFRQDTIFSPSGNRLAIVQSYGSIQGPAYLYEINIVPDSSSYQWRLMTTGAGKFDIWKFYDGTGQPGYVNTNLPAASIVPEIIHYKLPDSLSTIVSGFNCLENVISVGNFGNRKSYVDFNGNTYTDNNVTRGQIITNSSWGPTRDGRIKPDISAPGSITLSAGQLSLMAIWQSQPGNVVKIAEGGFHFRDGGTSSSAPVVAGIAALYLEQNPTATAMQVKNAILNCAVQDTFTGTNLPNVIWGHGKADAFNTLTNCALTSLQENNNPVSFINLYPNPVSAGEFISIRFNKSSGRATRQIVISDALGRVVQQLEASDNGAMEISTKGVRSGVYAVSLIEDGKISKAGRLTVLE
jgi:subtilisin family serine protease